MNRYTEISEIAEYVAKIKELSNKLAESFDTEGIDWFTAELVDLSDDQLKHFKDPKANGETDDYFVEQWRGYCEDDFYGNLFFETDIEGRYVKVFFEP